jgi:hypothetical protein
VRHMPGGSPRVRPHYDSGFHMMTWNMMPWNFPLSTARRR